MRFWIFQIANGLTTGAILFFVAAGLTVITGLMRVLNLAHGAIFLVGGYIGLTTAGATGSFFLGLGAGAVAAGIIGLVMRKVFSNVLLGSTFNQVLLTLGIAFIIGNGLLQIFGGRPRRLSPPEFLAGSISIFGITYPWYRIALIILAVATGIALYLLWERSLLGAMIRACVDDRSMAAAMGIPVDKVFAAVLALGSAFAGLAGVLTAPVQGIYIGLDFEVLLLAVIVMVVGGMGSLTGAFVASILVGLIDAFGRASFPELSAFTLFAPVILILVLRPQGLLGRIET